MQEKASFSLKKGAKIRKNKEFRKVYHYGKSWANKYLVLYMLKQKNAQIKVGFSVSKKVGNAVVRNSVKRRLKEAFRLNQAKIQKNQGSFIFIARQKIKEADFKEIEKSVLDLLKRADKA